MLCFGWFRAAGAVTLAIARGLDGRERDTVSVEVPGSKPGSRAIPDRDRRDPRFDRDDRRDD
jgi:hypothetical protein